MNLSTSPRASLTILVGLAGMTGLAGAGCQQAKTPPAGRPGMVLASPVDDVGAAAHPMAEVWASVPATAVPLLRQDVTEPKLLADAVRGVEVQALHDRQNVVFRLRWRDPTRDTLAGEGRFGDACAVQVPGGTGGDLTDPAMGLPGRSVHISHWRAAWQETGDPVAALRPNMVVDHYPFQAAKEGTAAAMARAYAPARAADNPVTARPVGRAAQDLVAEGPGTITHAAVQRSEGRGVWRDGVWTVAIVRPLLMAPASALPVGRRTHMALAVWEGGAGNTGAKKMRTSWLPLTLEVPEQTPGGTPVGTPGGTR